MVVCKKVRIPRRSLCAGDLNRLITVDCRTLDFPDDSTTDYSNTFNSAKKVWAGLRTTKGKDVFFATNVDQAVTHVFYMRYLSWLTSDQWINYRGQNYDIIEVENLDEANEWCLAYCNVRGCADEAMNHA